MSPVLAPAVGRRHPRLLPLNGSQNLDHRAVALPRRPRCPHHVRLPDLKAPAVLPEARLLPSRPGSSPRRGSGFVPTQVLMTRFAPPLVGPIAQRFRFNERRGQHPLFKAAVRGLRVSDPRTSERHCGPLPSPRWGRVTPTRCRNRRAARSTAGVRAVVCCTSAKEVMSKSLNNQRRERISYAASQAREE